MAGSEIKKYTISEASKLTGKSCNALMKKAMRQYKKSGVINIPGTGYFAVTKPGKLYRLVKIKPDEKQDAVNKRIKELLVLLKEYVCADCSKIIEKAVENVK